MQGGLAAGRVMLCLALMVCQGAMAFGVSGVTIDPPGAMTQGTPVVITGTIIFEPSFNETFNSSHELQFITDVQEAQWNITLILDGNEKTQIRDSGRILSIGGKLLSSPDTGEESMRFTLSGIAPVIDRTQNKTLLMINESDNKGQIVGSLGPYQTVIVHSCCVVDHFSVVNSELETYRNHIDEKSARDIDTSAAEVKYSEAVRKIQTAKNTPSSRYLLAFNNIVEARVAISDGERFLDKAWAEKEVADAQEKVDEAGAIIGWFRGNQSTADDPLLPAIVANHEAALNNLSAASDEISRGNYEPARARAQEAYLNANESYNNAVAQKTLRENQPCNLCITPVPGVLLFAAVFIAILLCVAGIFLWKKHRRS